jgi:ABC-2 type transport system permease protein
MVATHVVMLVLNLVLRLANGAAPPALRSSMPLGELWAALLYGLAAMALWLAPLYGWLLLVSAWARRAPFLWASLPLIIIGILEKVALNTSHFADFLSYRLFGWFEAAFGGQRPCCIPHPLSAVAAGQFLTTPGLWTGLVMAAVFLAVAARLRRYRGPI